MKKSSFYFAALLILVVVIIVLGFLILQRKAPAEPTPTDAPVIHPPVEESLAPTELPTAPAVQENTAEGTPKPTETPVFETRPPVKEAPEEEPAPTEKPVAADASGSFRSDTGTGLNLKVDWNTFTNASGTRTLQINVSTLSYSFYTTAQYQSIVLTVDGRTYKADCPSVSYDGQDLVETPLASFTVDAPASAGPASVMWHYNGTYSGKELNDIIAAGVIG